MTNSNGQDSRDNAQPCYVQITERIRSLIDQGSLCPGDRLPPERTLAETFRVSRNSVREALRSLSEQGVVESRRGDGTYVLAQSGEGLAEAFAQAFEAQRERLGEIFQFRRMIEPGIAERAARNASPEQIVRLKVLVCDQQRRLLAGEDDSDLDAAFHLELARASGNRVVTEALSALHDILAETRSEFLQTRQRRDQAVEAHLRIIDALEAHDAAAASQAMDAHLRTVEKAALGRAPVNQGTKSTKQG